jgi:hypothetical protein
MIVLPCTDPVDTLGGIVQRISMSRSTRVDGFPVLGSIWSICIVVGQFDMYAVGVRLYRPSTQDISTCSPVVSTSSLTTNPVVHSPVIVGVCVAVIGDGSVSIVGSRSTIVRVTVRVEYGVAPSY